MTTKKSGLERIKEALESYSHGSCNPTADDITALKDHKTTDTDIEALANTETTFGLVVRESIFIMSAMTDDFGRVGMMKIMPLLRTCVEQIAAHACGGQLKRSDFNETEEETIRNITAWYEDDDDHGPPKLADTDLAQKKVTLLAIAEQTTGVLMKEMAEAANAGTDPDIVAGAMAPILTTFVGKIAVRVANQSLDTNTIGELMRRGHKQFGIDAGALHEDGSVKDPSMIRDEHGHRVSEESDLRMYQ